MKLSLINFQSGEEFILDAENPIIIGRGSLLKCFDKKISRNHGQIQLTSDGNVHLKALHSNPCFVMKNGLPPVIQLAKDKGKILCNDDYIGLLPDSFWYKIVVHNDETDNIFNNKLNVHGDWENETVIEPGNIFEKSISQINKSETVSMGIKNNHETLISGNDKELVPNTSEQAESITFNSSLSDKLKLLENTKKLPLSMYEIDDLLEKVKGDMKNMQSLESSKEVKVQFKENVDCCETDSLIGTITEDTNYPQKVLTTDKEKEGLMCLVANEIDIKSEGESEKENPSNSRKVNTDIIHFCTSDNSDISSNPTRLKRPICQYEEKCYRKNVQHKREFCHPGDSDFIPHKIRPVCQYGLFCYRKDRSHKIEYQHVKRNLSENSKGKSPDNSKGKNEKLEEKFKNAVEEDDYDDEDPFLDDGSSDDYVPSDIESDEDSRNFSIGSDSDSDPKRRKLEVVKKNKL